MGFLFGGGGGETQNRKKVGKNVTSKSSNKRNVHKKLR